MSEYVNALETELKLRAPASGWDLETLYMGGGTPSRLGGEGVAMLMDMLSAYVRLDDDAEVTLEANPDDVTPTASREWLEAGITRISLGVQSFDDRVLTWMHRTHDSESSVRAVATLRDAGLSALSLDLIFALPESLERDWNRDLSLALDLLPDHLSLYGLTVEPGTPLGRWVARGEAAEAPEESYARDFLAAHSAAEAHGLEHYEVSNFARAGRRARHNSAYWRNVPYAAVGPAAHAFDGEIRSWNVASYTEWVRRLGSGEDPRAAEELLDEENRAAERIYLGLRTSTGLVLAQGELESVKPWIAAGWAELDGSTLRLTPEGWLRLDSLAASLTVAPSPS